MSVIPAPPRQAELPEAQPRTQIDRIRRRLERYYADSFVPCFVPRGGRCGDLLVKLSNDDYDVGWVAWEDLPLECPPEEIGGINGGLPDTIFILDGVDGAHPDTTFTLDEVDAGTPDDI
jgi:hypothetical protein